MDECWHVPVWYPIPHHAGGVGEVVGIRKSAGVRGFTLLEIIVALMLAGAALSVALVVFNSRPLNLGADVRDLVLNLQVAREFAVSRTQHYRLRALTTTAPYQYVIEGFNGTSWVKERTITLRRDETFTTATLGTIAEFDTGGLLITVPAPVTFTLYDSARNWTKQVSVNAVGLVSAP